MESPELEGLKKLRTGFLIFIALEVVAVALVFTTVGAAIGVLGRGIDALSALMPTVPSANTNLTTLMIGERFGEWLRDGAI